MTRTLPWQKPDPVKNYYPVPKVICQLGLSPGEIAVYSFLLFCEDRKTYQCYPSYRTIGDAVGMSRNTVCKYVRSLEEKGLIRTERTSIVLKNGRKRNGSLLYTLLPWRQAVEQFHQRHLAMVEAAAERQEVQQNWRSRIPPMNPRVRPVNRCVASFGAGQRPCPGEGSRAVFGRICGGFLSSAEDEGRSRRKALALFSADAGHGSPQCGLPRGFAGFWKWR